jgi:hypothetical protein
MAEFGGTNLAMKFLLTWYLVVSGAIAQERALLPERIYEDE